MEKNEQIKNLKIFSKLIDDWFDAIRISADEKRIRAIETAMNDKYGIIKGIFDLLDINYKGDLSGNASNEYKDLRGDFFIEGFIGMDAHPYKVRNLRIVQSLVKSTVGKIRTGFIAPIDISHKKIKKEWYQKWWGILILGIIGSGIISLIFYFLANKP